MKTLILPLAALALFGAAEPKTNAKPTAHKADKATAGKDAAKAGTDKAAPATTVNLPVLHVQVVLDKLGFSPGLLDGKRGQSLTSALKGFQESRGLPITGKIDQATLQALQPYAGWRAVRRLRLDAASIAGPYINPLPESEMDKAKLPGLYYRNALEALAERFHTTPATLIALNSRETQLVPGAMINFPNALPTSRNYTDGDDKWKATLTSLNVDANAPKATKVVVDKSDKVLRLYDAQERLIGQYPVTTGSEHDPLPLGTWKITAVSKNPPFHYNPKLFWDAKATDKAATLPPGPNGPVGVVWIDLSKEHYGIHGTPNPELIGRSESHGCIRLSNWDAARVALMVKAGTPAIFQA